MGIMDKAGTCHVHGVLLVQDVGPGFISWLMNIAMQGIHHHGMLLKLSLHKTVRIVYFTDLGQSKSE